MKYVLKLKPRIRRLTSSNTLMNTECCCMLIECLMSWTHIYLHTYLPFDIRYITEDKATDKKLTYMKDKSKIYIEYTI